MELSDIQSLDLHSEHLQRVVVLTGAGISAESGIPTFRGEEGYWRKYRPEELATPQAFLAQPTLVWEWYLYRRQLIGQSQPNAGHQALVELGSLLGQNFTLITQNVDGLHQVAGSKGVLELHGNIFTNRCFKCSRHYSNEMLDFQNLPPICPHCQGWIRPDVVWFGESLDITLIEDAFSFSRQATLFLSVGTSAVVHPAASLPLAALENGAYLIEINPDLTPISAEAQISLRASAAQALPQLAAKIKRVTSTLS